MRPPLERPTRCAFFSLEKFKNAEQVKAEVVELQWLIVILRVAVNAGVPRGGF
jgi:hypothetical protein